MSILGHIGGSLFCLVLGIVLATVLWKEKKNISPGLAMVNITWVIALFGGSVAFVVTAFTT